MIKITWFGTATIRIEVNGEKLLFDPFFRRNKRLEQPPLETFCNVEYIFNTHSHFDHLCDMKQILQNSEAQFYGSSTAYKRLKAQEVDVENKVSVIHPNETIFTQNTQVLLHNSKHIKNNLGIILKTALRVIFKFQVHKAVQILNLHNDYRMGGEIVAFEIDAEDKKILLFGSAGIDENVELPKDIDVLIWPFQGRTGMTKYSLPIIEKINPKIVILDHFDDAFPPITGTVKTEKVIKTMKKKHPKMSVLVPEFGKTIEI